MLALILVALVGGLHTIAQPSGLAAADGGAGAIGSRRALQGTGCRRLLTARADSSLLM